MSTVTKPPLLDETGQSIATTLGNVSIRSAVVDNCTTQDSSKALSANQGKILNDKIEYGCRRNVGELVFSSIELNDAGLKLADGSYIVRGVYSDFYDMIVSIYNSEDWTAPDTSGYIVQPKDVWQAQKNSNNGIIGKYGYDSANNRVYLPDLRNAFIEGTEVSELSKFMQAGVPNIEGKTSAPVSNSGGRGLANDSSYQGKGAFETQLTYETKLYESTPYSSSLYYYGDKFDASKGEVHNGSYSNLVYGKSDTVQPPAVKYFIYIVIANMYKSPVQIDIDNMLAEVRDMMYPIGSIYMSRDNTSPASLFGGTWTRIKDKFLMTYGDTYTQSGGRASVTLAEANLPSHSHSFTPSGSLSGGAYKFSGTASSGTLAVACGSNRVSGTGVFSSTALSSSDSQIGNTGGGVAHTKYTLSLTPSGTVSVITHPSFTGTAGTTGSTGSGSSFSILPPYDVVYAWERTA